MGSIFVTTTECDASGDVQKNYIESSKEDIEIIASPVGMPGRAIGGEFLRKVKAGLTRPKRCPFHCIKTCDYTKSPYCIILALANNAAKGNLTRLCFRRSQRLPFKKITSVKETSNRSKPDSRRRQVVTPRRINRVALRKQAINMRTGPVPGQKTIPQFPFRGVAGFSVRLKRISVSPNFR